MKSYLLNQAFIEQLLIDDRISILDGGARGEVFAPFNKVSKSVLKVIRFEPDPNAEIIENEDEIVVPKGLWSKKEKLTLNLAVSPSASSVLDFNTTLQSYIDPLRHLRKTEKQVEVDCINIDQFLEETDSINQIDFIKLDIHGAEYEVIKGASTALGNTIALLIESWTIPIHKDQKTRAAVEDSVNSRGFYLFEEFAHSKWSRHSKSHTKKQPVSIDSLYFKDPLLDNNIKDQNTAVKLIGIADLFHHTGFAIQLAKHFYKKGTLSDSLYNNISTVLDANFKESFITRFKHKLYTKLEYHLNECSFK